MDPLIVNFRLEGIDFHFPILTKELVPYMFIRNSSCKEQIFMVPLISL